MEANDVPNRSLNPGIRDRMGTTMQKRALLTRVRGPLAGSIGLRPATATDDLFLYRVYASTREEEFRHIDWEENQKAALLAMQYHAQGAAYRQGFPGSGYEVILLGDQPIGRLFVHRDAGAIRVVDIGLLPEYRNRGIAGALLEAVLDEAAESGKPVRLHVDSSNRAVRLYERLGFRPDPDRRHSRRDGMGPAHAASMKDARQRIPEPILRSRRITIVTTRRRIWPVTIIAMLCSTISIATPHSRAIGADDRAKGQVQRRLYVAEPGIRNYLEYGGHGLLVFDIDHGHRFVKRIPTAGLDAKGKPINVKGICASAATKRLYISTIKQLMCLDLVTEKLLWEKTYDAGLRPDGDHARRHARSSCRRFEGPLWYVVRAEDGEVVARITPDSGSHNTIVGLDGKEAYLAGLEVAVPDGRRHADASGRSARSVRSARASGRSRSTAGRRSAS